MPEAITKNRQSENVIRNLCKKAFGDQNEAVSIKELTDGYCNTAYDIRLSDGKEVIMKVAPFPSVKLMSCEVDLMKTEVSAMLHAEEMGMYGVPKILFFDDSCEICTSTCFLMEKLDGNTFSREREHMSEEDAAILHAETGKYLQKLHQIKGEKFGHFCRSELQGSEWFDTFEMLIRRVIGDGIAAGIDIGVCYDEILERLHADRCHFEEVKEPCFLHWDSWEGNIFVKDSKIIGFIDWERAMWGDPLMEDRFRTHSVNPDFLRGYGITELTESQRIRCRWYDVYLYLIMMFEGFYRQYPDDSLYQWVHGIFEKVWEDISK